MSRRLLFLRDGLRFLGLMLAVVCALGSAVPARAWVTGNYNGVDYVTLKSFCEFYSFDYSNPAGENFAASSSKSAGRSLRFKLNNNVCQINGIKYWMSFDVIDRDNEWWISRIDVVKLFEPVMNPSGISGRHPVKGVVIDPGHGGGDRGADAGGTRCEKNYTLDTSFRLERLLKDSGIPVVMTRRSDVFIELYQRAYYAAQYPDYIFVSIHFNSASSEAHGLETYCVSPRGSASTSAEGHASRADFQRLPGNDNDLLNILLAHEIHRQVLNLLPPNQEVDRGVKRARFVVVKENKLPSVLVEGGFISNRNELEMIDRAEYRQRLAELIGRGIMAYTNQMPGGGSRRLVMRPGAAPGASPTLTAPTPPVALANDRAGVAAAIPAAPTGAPPPPPVPRSVTVPPATAVAAAGTVAPGTPIVAPEAQPVPPPAPAILPKPVVVASREGGPTPPVPPTTASFDPRPIVDPNVPLNPSFNAQIPVPTVSTVSAPATPAPALVAANGKKKKPGATAAAAPILQEDRRVIIYPTEPEKELASAETEAPSPVVTKDEPRSRKSRRRL